ncbi:MAG: PilW family protein [Gemmatimonadota bacterium]
MNTDRRGFTLVELIVVAVLGTLVVAAALQVLITNQRTYTAGNAKIQGQQTTRAAMDILTNELREISAQGGDILAMGGDSLTIRAMRKFAIVCEVNLSAPPKLKAFKVGDWFEADDSVFVFADNDQAVSSDDTWIAAKVTAVDTTASCGGTTAQELTFSGQSATFTADSVRTGAPIRSFTRFTYGLVTYNGDTYLGRRDASGTEAPLVGPLASNGVSVTYLDGNGNVTTTPTDVRQVLVTIRTSSGVLSSLGEMVADSITTRIYTRN